MKITTPGITIKPYTQSQLIQLYNISAPIFKKWIKPHQKHIGHRKGRYYTIQQVIIIFEKLGVPGMYVED